ncbi:MAG: hypothetical protein ACP5J9_08790 [Dictyoglomus sp.]
MKKILISFLTITFLISLTFASDTGGVFSPLILDAKSGGMGEAFTAISEGFSGLTYNPAGLTYIDEVTLGFTHLQIPQSFTRVEFIGGAINLGIFSLGAGLQAVWVTNPDELLFPYYEGIAQISLAKKLNNKLSLGTSLRLYVAKLDTEEAHGLGIDIGAIYEITPVLRLGAVWYNPISYIKWTTGLIETPGRQDLVLGVNYKLFLGEFPLNIAFDFSFYDKIYFYQRLHFGLETQIPKTPVIIRTGYNGEKNTLSFGVGLNTKNIEFNYAFLYTKDMSNQHIFSLSLKY